MQLLKSAFEFAPQQCEVPLDALGTTDHHMIRAWKTFEWHDLTGKCTKPALHAIAYHRIADLLGYGEADAHRGVRVITPADEKYEAGRGCAQAAVGGDEIRALADAV